MVNQEPDPGVSPPSPQLVAHALEQLLCLLAKEVAKQLITEAQAPADQSTIEVRITYSRDPGGNDPGTPDR